jgi:hypothetical protein
MHLNTMGLVALLALNLLVTPLRSYAQQAVFVVYMQPPQSGCSDNDGRTEQSAVCSLEQVEQVLERNKPTTDVEVRIKQGTYVAPTTSWRFYVPGHTISFMPIDYQYGEGVDGIAGRPIFWNAKNADGTYRSGAWMYARRPTDTTHPLYTGGTSGLRFFYLQIQYYPAAGIVVDGDSGRDYLDERYSPPLRKRASQGLNGNTFFGVVFTHIGNKWAPGNLFGFAGIQLTNSSHNRIENNHFLNIENSSKNNPSDPARIHGIYITHFSSTNSIMRNRFSYNSGTPVKLRDRSNYNTVASNEFIRSGDIAFYYEEFCNQQCTIDHNHERECASYGNRFDYNRLLSDYDGDNSSLAWALKPPGLTNAGEPPCSIPDGVQRLRTAGNTTE